ncbi:50S ribosomal protein L30 [Enterococcus timonensis]|uniref:50S ribosomal protein L30 n=1 Tax=Enterococcus timonensis TaxID=1852364 RepID=UPI0008DA6784|nr:50S ribosomal protein L30 [Enterococcus timonensis]
MAELKITLKRSIIGRPLNQRETVKALGLKKINSSVVKNDGASILGMIKTVSHLVDVEEVK